MEGWGDLAIGALKGRLNDIAAPEQCFMRVLAIANKRSLPSGKSYVLVYVRSTGYTGHILYFWQIWQVWQNWQFWHIG